MHEHGGKREGSGRKKQGDEVFYKRCTKEQKEKLNKCWENIKKRPSN